MYKFLFCAVVIPLAISTACLAKSDKEKIMDAHGKMKSEMDKDPLRYQRECDAGRAHSCTREGIFYAFGTWGHKKDYAKAKPLFEKGCNAGDQEGCKELAVLYQYGRGTAKDLKKAGAIFAKACAAGYKAACNKNL